MIKKTKYEGEGPRAKSKHPCAPDDQAHDMLELRTLGAATLSHTQAFGDVDNDSVDEAGPDRTEKTTP